MFICKKKTLNKHKLSKASRRLNPEPPLRCVRVRLSQWPRGIMPQDVVVGPKIFQDYGAQNSMYNNTEMLFLTTEFIKISFWSPS